MCGTDKNCGCAHVKDECINSPRFIQPVSMARPEKVFLANGYITPTQLPTQIMTQDGSLGLYEDLYGAPMAYNNVATVGYEGSWGHLHAAGKAR